MMSVLMKVDEKSASEMDDEMKPMNHSQTKIHKVCGM